MVAIPRPPEPSIETLREAAEFVGVDVDSADGESQGIELHVLKAGMLRYMWQEWRLHEVPREELRRATDDEEDVIEGWANGEYPWSKVVNRYRNQLNLMLE